MGTILWAAACTTWQSSAAVLLPSATGARRTPTRQARQAGRRREDSSCRLLYLGPLSLQPQSHSTALPAPNRYEVERAANFLELRNPDIACNPALSRPDRPRYASEVKVPALL